MVMQKHRFGDERFDVPKISNFTEDEDNKNMQCNC